MTSKISTACRLACISEPIRELQHIPGRRFRLDYAWPDQKIGLEVQGGIWTRGRHSRGPGQLGDMEKNNLGIINGWRVFQCPPGAEGKTILDFISKAFGDR